jgi:hypothetical protein
MPDVVTPFDRKQATQPTQPTQPTQASPRHRRDGEFDDDGQWHDTADSPFAANG